ncbi:MAG TPA: hypothetical protein DEA40_08530 [Parvularcula sp.]|nr:hypothetical protein [Parvularcula sp.]HBS34597.1 hypothetical protein [Parvularcula sp.]
MSGKNSAPAQPKPRLILFAFGDFGFNLYWQSLSLFLLFYYTETLGVSIAAAAAVYMLASVFDGFSGFAIGLWIDRRARPEEHRRMLIRAAFPLALAFMLAYAPAAHCGRAGLVFLFASQLLLRLSYGFANLHYLAMTARVSLNQRDRSLVAGLRMVFGALAAILVSLTMRPLGIALTGSEQLAHFSAAAVYAVAATAVIILVGATFKDASGGGEGSPAETGGRRSVMALLHAVAANRSFLSVAAAMMAMIISVTMVSKLVLYYFKYGMSDTRAGELALADMVLVGLIAVPIWMLVERRIGTRRTWGCASALALVLLAGLTFAGARNAGASHFFLVAFQAAVMGVDFSLWALLPATVDAGPRPSGARAEATLFGLVEMLQRISIGVATGLAGLTLGFAGLKPGEPLTEASSLALRLQISVVPLVFLAASALLILRRKDVQPRRR